MQGRTERPSDGRGDTYICMYVRTNAIGQRHRTRRVETRASMEPELPTCCAFSIPVHV